METKFRPVAVPLVTVDPYFSVWSMSDKLMHDHTRHWTTTRNGMVGMVSIDGKVWRFMGRLHSDGRIFETKTEPDGMDQKTVSLTPLSSKYIFEASGIRLEVTFTTPLLLDDLDLLSRPSSYIHFTVSSIDGYPHDVKVYFDVTGEWCVDTPDQKILWSQKYVNPQMRILCMGTEDQKILNSAGDDKRIDWGYFYMSVPASNPIETFIKPFTARDEFMKTGTVLCEVDTDMPRSVNDNLPVMGAVINFNRVENKPQSQLIILAYDDIYSVEYFGVRLSAYWKKNFRSIEELILKSAAEYDEIMSRCEKLDTELILSATEVGGEKYAQLLSLAYRQAIAAHKLVLDEDGKILFLSKECFSNGCIGTVDVSYPSVPLFLLYNPELVNGMIRPIFRYAKTEEWCFDFAPHDIGTYPLANGQRYSHDGEKLVETWQMPVEECGNMLIMTTVTTLASGSTKLAEENMDLLEKWVRFLLEKGLDPGEQLCTDDFAGKLSHNTNLSIKAIIGVGCFALLLKLMGRTDVGSEYMQKAHEMAKTWGIMADEGDHYKLTFDSQNTWSLKYNLVWDKLLGLNLFDEKVREKEVSFYLHKQNRYGTPLDSRRAFTKSDWLVWAASLASSREDFIKMIEPLWDFVNETPIRTPFTDFYGTLDGLQREFHHRSVIGGLFIRLLDFNV